MVTKKKTTIQTKRFVEKMIQSIKEVKRMEMPKKAKDDVLEILRGIHNGCMEWEIPHDDFEIIEELRI